MVKVVLFDYGGVVKEAHNLALDIPQIFNISKDEYAKLRPKAQGVVSQFNKGEINEAEFWQAFSAAIDKPVPENAAELSRKLYSETFVFIDPIIDLVKKLKEKGIRVAVLSNILPFQAEIIREKNGYDMFDNLFLSCEEGLEKPNYDFYLYALKHLDIKPEECILIDDKEKNLVPALNLGIKTILAEDPKQVEKDVFSLIENPT